MEFDPPLQEAVLLRRYKRFFADVQTPSGEALTLHCPNTGSMRNCLNEGGRVWFSRSTRPGRKLPGTWELCETPQGRLACINTQHANRVVAEALKAGRLPELAGFTALTPEVALGQSRMDFCLSYPQGVAYLEVKSVTLGFADTEVAAFPDAVSVRAARHLAELTAVARSGQRAVLLYCVNLTGIRAVRPAAEIDAGYAAALQVARQAGVEVLAYGVNLSPQALTLGQRLAVEMG